MRINTNMMAINAQNKLRVNQGNVEKSIQKLSSGMRINSAADDAAGLAISEKMRAQIRGLSQAQDNAQDGISLIQTAEGALQQTTDILQRMRELVIKSQNSGVLSEDDRSYIVEEMSTLRNEIDRIATSTTFNGKKLLDGSLAVQRDEVNPGTLAVGIVNVVNANESTTYTIIANIGEKAYIEFKDEKKTSTISVTSDVIVTATMTGKITFRDAGMTLTINLLDNVVDSTKLNGKTIETADPVKSPEGTILKYAKADFQIGANGYSADMLSLGIGNMTSTGLNIEADGNPFKLDISTKQAANDCLKAIDYAIDEVSSQRATLGAIQNRMEYAVSNLSVTEENLTAAESRIRDVDMADEMVKYTKDSILNQSAMAMLAQANQQPQSILSLLQ